MTTVEDVLERIRESSETEKEKGDKFERLMVAFFKTDPAYKRQFSEVWLWSDWPGNEGKPDTGIDLVAKNTNDDGFTAIQCKCYAPTTTLHKSDIDGFFTESGRTQYTNRIIACTTNDWSTHAENALKGQDKPVLRIGVESLDNSSIDWGQWDPDDLANLRRLPRKKQRKHQIEAIEAVIEGFGESDRGKLIMACGTGKTYTAQCIAEQHVGPGGTVLVLVPSISLLSQTLKEWTSDASIPIAVYAVCSDTKAGRKRASEDMSPYDLVLPATTDPDLLAAQFKRAASKDTMSVVFSTYQSISVIGAAQTAGVPDFDLVVADEAHRTTGVTLAGEDDKIFTRVHDDVHIKADKRLYMTATPRVYSDAAKGKAQSADAWLASMDDVGTFGPEFHRLGFNEAVTRNLLTDYKVLVLAVDEEAVSAAFQQQLSDENHELQLDDATRIVGCVNALAKRDVYGETFGADDLPMQRAVAFSNTIAHSKKFKGLFAEIAHQWNSSLGHHEPFHVEVDHVDGKFNSMQREELLRWLKEDLAEDACHVLSNAKCLTEGVDVPALDAILFLEPRNSMVDVIQAVGRVMRKVEGKAYGYVVLPVGIPADETPERVLSDNNRFKAVWQVLNALRSHDERMNAVINQLDLNEEPPDMIEVVPVGLDIPEDDTDPESEDETEKPRQLALTFPLEEIREGIYAKLVLKVGTRHYWEDWANDVAEIAGRHQSRINALLDDPKLGLGAEFDHFVDGLHTIINDSVTRDDAIAMLSQHLITKPVFDTLFTDYDFTANNPVSKAMQIMIDRLDEHSLEKETESLEGFYDGVRLRVEGIDNAAGKQRIITELYEGFFSKAFPKAADSLGIVYTPVEVVDFVLHAAGHALRRHFDGTSISNEGVNVLDPFCGTGTFLVRLLQSGIIKPEDLARKYATELHSNELLLLAYYIAAVNIESTYHDLVTENGDDGDYKPFNGIVLTDTFQLGETGEGTGTFDVFPVNNMRASTQKNTGMRVIVGNPPYSTKQTSVNDANANLDYPLLDQSIASTYSAVSKTQNRNYLRDSYIRGIRWATNRLTENPSGGVMAFVVNNGYLDALSAAGFRISITRDFHHIYVYNLRGNSNNAATAKQEGGNVFNIRVGVSILIGVREAGSVPNSGAVIHYAESDDFLTRDEKLSLIDSFAVADSLDQIPWEAIEPNTDGDWINQRSEVFDTLTPVHSETEPSVFQHRSRGLATCRDAWNYNSSLDTLRANAKRMVEFYNQELDRFHAAHPNITANVSSTTKVVKEFVNLDKTKFSWDSTDFKRIATSEKYEVPTQYWTGTYRPFFKQHVTFDKKLNSRVYQLPRIFPEPEHQTLAICVTPPGSMAPPFSALMVDGLADLGIFWGGTQILPLLIEPVPAAARGPATLLDEIDPSAEDASTNISTDTLTRYREWDSSITDQDIFFYTYGVLYSPEYRSQFAKDLKKTLPRIPEPPSADIFWNFSSAGEQLSDIHVGYESQPTYEDLDIEYADGFDNTDRASFRVTKMTYPKISNPHDPEMTISDLSIIVFNSAIRITNIPIEAHEFRIGSRSAIDWIVNKYQVGTDKSSGILNDPNDWADEHDDPTYIFDLLRRIVTVSMKTNEIVAGLPKLKF